jgi:16S rRNA (guanine527-N7)-methyltransferase
MLQGMTPAADRGGPEAAVALRRICAELRLEASELQIESMAAYLELLQRWNRTYNLTAVRESEQVLTLHLADCLAAVAALQRSVPASTPLRILDVGSGGGLPGVLLALFRPASEVVCVDAVAKKAAFVREVAGRLGLPNLRAEHARVERWRGGPFDLIAVRAFASLPELVRLTRPLLAPAGRWMAMKGKPPDAEIAALPADIDAFHVEPLSVPGLDASRCLVWMRLRRDS